MLTDTVTITQYIKRPKVYDGKKLWEAYHKLGRAATHEKLREIAEKEGMLHHGKKQPSQMGAFWAMWRYAVHNPEEAYPAYEQWAKEYESELIAAGIPINFKMFLEDVRKHAKSAVSPQAYLEFCEKYGLNPNAPIK